MLESFLVLQLIQVLIREHENIYGCHMKTVEILARQITKVVGNCRKVLKVIYLAWVMCISHISVSLQIC